MKKSIFFTLLAIAAVLGSFVDSHASGFAAAGMFPVLGGSKVNFNKIEREAEQFLSSYDGFDNYSGEGDEFLQFAQNGSSFASEVAKAKTYNITIANAHTATQNVLFAPGIIWTPGGTNNGLIKTGAIDGLTSCTASGSPGSLEAFVQEYRNTPVRLLGMKISSDQVAQINQIMTIQKETSTQTLATTPVPLMNFSNEYVYKDKVVTVDLRGFNIQLDFCTKITMPVVASSSTTFTLYLGAAISVAWALEQKANRAQSNLVAASAPNALTSGYRGRR